MPPNRTGGILTDADLAAITQAMLQHKANCNFSLDEVTTLRTLARIFNSASDQFSKIMVMVFVLGIGLFAYLFFSLKGAFK